MSQQPTARRGLITTGRQTPPGAVGGVVVFSVELPPAVLRRNVHTVARRKPAPGQSARRAVHWSDRSKAAEEYAEAVWIACRLQAPYGSAITGPWWPGDARWEPWEKARVRYVWHSTHQVDEDNAIASMKVALDCLTTKGRRPLRLIRDDKGVSVSATWAKVKTKAEERVEIRIEEVVEGR